jgi:hypothetical protein
MGMRHTQEKVGRLPCRDSGMATLAVVLLARPLVEDGNHVSGLFRRDGGDSFCVSA